MKFELNYRNGKYFLAEKYSIKVEL